MNKTLFINEFEESPVQSKAVSDKVEMIEMINWENNIEVVVYDN